MTSPALDASLPNVAILLCTFNGQRYLGEQLDSIAGQSYSNWKVWASDDGSYDDTPRILSAYRQAWGAERLSVREGPLRGFTANFLSLTCDARIQADFWAFSDQDDIWECDKLQRAMAWLRTVPNEVPALYCSRTRLVDLFNREIGLSPCFKRLPSFGNALMQNIGGGNTMVFNEATRALLCAAGPDVDVVIHDWWVYLVVSGCGGRIYYDEHPSLRYRQHSNNLIGMNLGWRARLARAHGLIKGERRNWNDRHIRALSRLGRRLTSENVAALQAFAEARNEWLLPRLLGLKRANVYCQTPFGNAGLMAAAIFNRI